MVIYNPYALGFSSYSNPYSALAGYNPYAMLGGNSGAGLGQPVDPLTQSLNQLGTMSFSLAMQGSQIKSSGLAAHAATIGSGNQAAADAAWEQVKTGDAFQAQSADLMQTQNNLIMGQALIGALSGIFEALV